MGLQRCAAHLHWIHNRGALKWWGDLAILVQRWRIIYSASARTFGMQRGYIILHVAIRSLRQGMWHLQWIMLRPRCALALFLFLFPLHCSLPPCVRYCFVSCRKAVVVL